MYTYPHLMFNHATDLHSDEVTTTAGWTPVPVYGPPVPIPPVGYGQVVRKLELEQVEWK